MSTVKEIADRAGVSPSSVSIVLSGQAEERKITKETQERILKAARQLGYTPNIMARRLRAGSSASRIIAMYQTADERAMTMIRFSHGLYHAVKRLAEPTLLFISQYDTCKLESEHSLFQKSTCNGAIICNTSERDITFLNNNILAFPCVLFNAQCENCSSVVIDDYSMGTEAVMRFNKQGCRRICILSSTVMTVAIRNRNNGILNGCKKYGIEPVGLLESETSIQGGYHVAEEILRLSPRPDCLFCTSDRQAAGCLKKFQEAGLSSPRDIKIIAIGNSSDNISAFVSPSISTFHLPLENMAAKCLELLIYAINEAGKSPQSVVVPYSFTARETCL